MAEEAPLTCRTLELVGEIECLLVICERLERVASSRSGSLARQPLLEHFATQALFVFPLPLP